MYKRVLLKMSGEALKGETGFGIDPATVKKIAQEVKEAHELGTEIGIVVGGGNIFRGHTGEELGMERAQADYMGMLATLMNSLALQDALEGLGVPTRVMSALPVDDVCEPFIRRRALRHLEKGRVVIFGGGTGMPYFSTDTTGALRATEIGAEIILMAKNGTDGVYNKDPRKFDDAVMYTHLTFDEMLAQGLGVMDLTAATMCKDNGLKAVVFNMNKEGNIVKAVMGETLGTRLE